MITLGHDADGKTYNYLITINTGQGRQSGTTAKVSLVMVGEHGSSGVIPISELTKARFNRGSQTKTTMCGPSKLGSLVYIQIWHDNSGDSPSWYLDSVNVQDTQTGEEWNFVYDKWLAVESEDGRIDALIYVANPHEFNSYKRIFASKTSRDLYDGHLWFSVARKPPSSHFTRVQRCSCCLSLLFCTMMANCMFYNLGEVPDDSSVLIIGPFKVSLRALAVGIQSSLVVFPVNLLITYYSDEAPGQEILRNHCSPSGTLNPVPSCTCTRNAVSKTRGTDATNSLPYSVIETFIISPGCSAS